MAIAAIRICIVLLGPRIGAILMGTPMIMFPLLAIQAWQGPPITQTQTAGSLASVTAASCALWLLRLPTGVGPIQAVLVVASVWFTLVLIFYLTGPSDWAMALILLFNTSYPLVKHRDHHPAAVPTAGHVTDGAVSTAVFLIAFFLLTRVIPDFLRGVLVSFPLGLLATIYFVRRVLPLEAFRSFILYTQGAIIAGAMFVLVVHYSLVHMRIVLVIGAALLVSLGATAVVGRIWRAPGVRVVQSRI